MILYPDKLLRKISTPVLDINEEVLTLVKNMQNELALHQGYGLSAIQIGVPLQCILVRDLVMINPQILYSSDEKGKDIEGCLSIPHIWEEIERSTKVIASYKNLDDKLTVSEFVGLPARILSHEMDHLNGVLMLDHLSRLKRSRALKLYGKKTKK